jgi:hypothetical protein
MGRPLTSTTVQIIAVLGQVFLVLCLYYGMGNNIDEVNPKDLAGAIVFEYAFNVASIMSTGFGKLAIIALLQGRPCTCSTVKY